MQILRACVNAVRAGIFSSQPAPIVGQVQMRSIGTVGQGILNGSSLPALTSSPFLSSALSRGNFFVSPALSFARSITRINFPRPRENKRINVTGWKKRMSTPSGRRVIMRRILKGRHSLSH
ncbi:unnamed protein product [Orchesella dallaii]|uniref:Large ribosomal subunit protein bL34m n=1 Tax=Orchesella dallaii TaxID=48710 RepID=A0ABP1QGW6_9HEXA